MKPIWWILPAAAAILWVGPAPADDGPRTPTETAAAYLAAMEASDLEAAEDLFAADSLIFETGVAKVPGANTESTTSGRSSKRSNRS